METTFEPPKPAPTVQPTARLTDPVSPEPMPVAPAPAPLTLNTRLLGEALERLIKRTLAFAESQPTPRANLSPADLAQIVLDKLKSKYSGKKFSGTEIRQVLNNIAREKADLVGHAIYPAHVLRIGTTSDFVLREDKHRPAELRGLPDDNGTLNAP